MDDIACPPTTPTDSPSAWMMIRSTVFLFPVPFSGWLTLTERYRVTLAKRPRHGSGRLALQPGHRPGRRSPGRRTEFAGEDVHDWRLEPDLHWPLPIDLRETPQPGSRLSDHLKRTRPGAARLHPVLQREHIRGNANFGGKGNRSAAAITPARSAYCQPNSQGSVPTRLRVFPP